MRLSRHAWLLCGLVAGCASTPPTWEKAGASAAAVQQDTDQCRMEARTAPIPPRHAPPPSGSGTVTAAIVTRDEELMRNETEAFQKCMSGKGYSAKR